MQSQKSENDLGREKIYNNNCISVFRWKLIGLLAALGMIIFIPGGRGLGLAWQEPGQLQVVWQKDLLSITATKVELATVLDDISRHTGIAIELVGKSQGEITVQFADLPLEQGIKKLANDVGMTFRQENTTGKIVLESVTVVSGANDVPVVTKEYLSLPRDHEGLTDLLKAPDQPLATRLQAGKNLLNQYPTDSVELFRLLIKDPSQRNLAYGLIRMLGTVTEPPAGVLLSQLAISHSHPTIRYKAIQTLGQTAGEDTAQLAVLKKAAMEDSDHLNRARAIISLSEAGAEGGDQFLLALMEKEKDPFVQEVCAAQLAMYTKK